MNEDAEICDECNLEICPKCGGCGCNDLSCPNDLTQEDMVTWEDY